MIKPLIYSLIFLLAACNPAMDEQRQTLQGEWQFNKITGPLGNEHKEVSEADRMYIHQDFTFLYQLRATDEHHTGSWDLGDEKLRLIYDQKEGEQRMDMIEYTIDSLSSEKLLLVDPQGIHYYLVPPAE